jgi:hypothetical protein
MQEISKLVKNYPFSSESYAGGGSAKVRVRVRKPVNKMA